MAGELVINGRPVPLTFRRNGRAKNIILKIDPKNGAAVVTLPSYARESEGLRFARSKMDWIAKRLAVLPQAVPFAAGTTVPLLGVDHVIRHQSDARGTAWIEEGEIHVAGKPEFLARRTADFLKKKAREEIVPRAEAYAKQVERKLGRITLRDTRSRWGSCAANGNLSFSWRLVLAPVEVLDYVVAHEVAHLVHHNHSPAYWAVVRALVPEADGLRQWLKTNGPQLHLYG